MSWSRTFVAAALLLALAGCGFRPLYGGGQDAGEGAAVAQLAAVEVAPIADRSGQQLRNDLIDLLDPARIDPPARYRLAVVLEQELSEFAIERTGFATRRNLRVEADYVLYDAATGAVLVAGGSRATTGYDIIDSKFSTLRAGQSAQTQALRQIATDIQRRLGVYFAGRPMEPPPPAGPGPIPQEPALERPK